MVSFAVAQIAQFVREKLSETIGMISFVVSGRKNGTIFGNSTHLDEVGVVFALCS